MTCPVATRPTSVVPCCRYRLSVVASTSAAGTPSWSRRYATMLARTVRGTSGTSYSVSSWWWWWGGGAASNETQAGPGSGGVEGATAPARCQAPVRPRRGAAGLAQRGTVRRRESQPTATPAAPRLEKGCTVRAVAACAAQCAARHNATAGQRRRNAPLPAGFNLPDPEARCSCLVNQSVPCGSRCPPSCAPDHFPHELYHLDRRQQTS